MVMNGFDTDGDGENNFYTVNGKAFYYAKYPIRVRRSETLRIYLGEPDRVRPHQLVPPPRRVLPLLPHRQHRPVRVHGHGGPVPGRARDHRDRLAQRRDVHVPRPPVRVRRAGLDGLLRRAATNEHASRSAHGAAVAAGACGCWRWCRSSCWSAIARGLRLVGRLDHRPRGRPPLPRPTRSTCAGWSSTRVRSASWCATRRPTTSRSRRSRWTTRSCPFTTRRSGHARAPALDRRSRSRSTGSRTIRTDRGHQLDRHPDA